MIKCFIFCVSFLVSGSVAAVAPFIKPCHATDSECIVNSAKIALPYLVPGITALGVPSLDPLYPNDITADTGELKLSFRNVMVHNLGKCKFNKIERDPVKSTGFLDVECPILCVGNYTFGGKLLFVEIEGDGPFEIKGDKLRVTVDIKLKELTKAGKKHYKIAGFDYKYNPLTKFTFKFHNLFNGDKAKAEPIEKIFDQSWKELITDVGHPVIKAILTQLVNAIDKFFQAIPAEELELV